MLDLLALLARLLGLGDTPMDAGDPPPEPGSGGDVGVKTPIGG